MSVLVLQASAVNIGMQKKKTYEFISDSRFNSRLDKWSEYEKVRDMASGFGVREDWGLEIPPVPKATDITVKHCFELGSCH